MPAPPCPLCRRPAVSATAPFCSRGCCDRDLLAWLGEGYRIAAAPADPDLPGAATDGLDSPCRRD